MEASLIKKMLTDLDFLDQGARTGRHPCLPDHVDYMIAPDFPVRGVLIGRLHSLPKRYPIAPRFHTEAIGLSTC